MTDIHLDFVDGAGRAALVDEVEASGADAVVITGDIATAKDVLRVLEELAGAVGVPLWYVLGNHDFYGGSIAGVRAGAALHTGPGGPMWLEAVGVVRLGPSTALVGVDGWGDARLGDFDGSGVLLNDFFRIEELTALSRRDLRERLQSLGDEAAAKLRPVLASALAWAEHLVVATHVPPFREACWHEGAVSSHDWLPFFSCAAVGTVLLEAASTHPRARMTVLCGHTHGAGEVRIRENLWVVTGGAEYGLPGISEVLVV